MSTDARLRWPKWTIPGYLNYYDQKYGGGSSANAGPQKVEPSLAAGPSGMPNAQSAFADPRQQSSFPSSKEPVGSTPYHYSIKTGPWFINMTTGVPFKEDETVKEEESSPKVRRIAREAIPPMAHDPTSESAGEEEIDDDEDWIYPPIQAGLRYDWYLRTSKALASHIGSIKVLVQPSFALKPMMEEAVIPSKAIKSTYSCYVREVTSYIASWSGCIPMRVLRRYRKKDDCEWIKLYHYCISEANLKNTHLYLKAKDQATLCGVLSNMGDVKPIIKSLTSQRFLNSAASSSSGSAEVSSGIRVANTGLFTDFDINRASKAKNRINMQGALCDQFAWANIHHVSVEDKSERFEFRCLEVVAQAADYAESLSKRSDDVKAGSSIHIWLSFAEFVSWSRDGINSRFSFDETVVRRSRYRIF